MIGYRRVAYLNDDSNGVEWRRQEPFLIKNPSVGWAAIRLAHTLTKLTEIGTIFKVHSQLQRLLSHVSQVSPELNVKTASCLSLRILLM